MLIAHSMGNPVTLYWLNNYVNDQTWKDKYIRYFVSLSPPWGGALKPLRLMASGDNIDILVVKPISVRPYQRSAPSTAFLMPSYNFWRYDEILVTRPAKNYTVHDFEDFFRDIKYPEGYELYKKTNRLLNEVDAPRVELHTLYGVDMKTPASFIYKKESDWPDSQPSVIYGDGDGTVNKRSLLGYQRWVGQQSQPIFFKVYLFYKIQKFFKLFVFRIFNRNLVVLNMSQL
jgi:lysophospholipase-3